MRSIFFAATLSVLAAVPFWSASSSLAADQSQLPAVIVCTISDTSHYAYLSVIEADGTARYQSVGGGVAEYSADGTVKSAGTMNTGDCTGKTIEKLRQDGQTREFEGS